MKTYLRILTYLRGYWAHLLISLFCIFMFTAFSGITLISVMPFLQVIFYSGDAGQREFDSGLTNLTLLSNVQEMGSQYLSPLKHPRDEVKRWISRVFIGSNPKSALLRICLIIVAIFFFKGLFGYLQVYFMARVEQGVIMDIRNELYRHISELSLGYFNTNRAGHLISRIANDVNLINSGVAATFVTLVKNPLLILAFLAIALYLSWQLTIVALIILPFSLTLIGAMGLKLRQDSAVSQEKMGNITCVLQETITGIRVVKAFGMEKFEWSNFTKQTKAYFSSLLRLIRIRGLASPLTEFLGALVGVGIIWIGGQKVLAGKALSPDEFITFLFVIFSIMNPVKELSTVNNRIQEAVAAGERVFSLMDTEPEIKNAPNAVKITELRNVIEFENVYFKYDEKKSWALQDINVQIRKGEILAIVGPSGAGKSTFVDLIPRFYDPSFGVIRLDGIDVREIDLKGLRALMGIVTQETILFHDTIFNNIAYGLTDISKEEVERAAKIANAHAFISELPDSYRTVVGERGVKLSGGQRQRIAIARAVLKNPPILILDEATSALDSESELLVQQAIERLMKNRTVFVIAHRLSTILHADRILVLDKGRIVQQGTHGELIRQKGLYQKLYQMQFRA